jgi:hypothetical protein
LLLATVDHPERDEWRNELRLLLTLLVAKLPAYFQEFEAEILRKPTTVKSSSVASGLSERAAVADWLRRAPEEVDVPRDVREAIFRRFRTDGALAQWMKACEAEQARVGAANTEARKLQAELSGMPRGWKRVLHCARNRVVEWILEHTVFSAFMAIVLIVVPDMRGYIVAIVGPLFWWSVARWIGQTLRMREIDERLDVLKRTTFETPPFVTR